MAQSGSGTESARTRVSFLSQRDTGVTRRVLRPSAKVLPEHARGHNRALVLQTLFTSGQQSRADVARRTGLTRVTVSDLVTELMAEGLLIETGQREGARPGKPAILLDIDRFKNVNDTHGHVQAVPGRMHSTTSPPSSRVCWRW